MLGFIIGLFVGGFLGVAIMCLLQCGSRSDEIYDKLRPP